MKLNNFYPDPHPNLHGLNKGFGSKFCVGFCVQYDISEDGVNSLNTFFFHFIFFLFLVPELLQVKSYWAPTNTSNS